VRNLCTPETGYSAIVFNVSTIFSCQLHAPTDLNLTKNFCYQLNRKVDGSYRTFKIMSFKKISLLLIIPVTNPKTTAGKDQIALPAGKRS